MKKFSVILALLFSIANGGVFTDKLSECLIKKSKPEEIKLLKRWIFFAYAQDSDLKKYVSISSKDEDEVNKEMGEYVTTLLSDRCSKELKDAIKYEGPQAIANAFGKLGEIAGMYILESKETKEFLGKFANHIDATKLLPLLQK
ncbi:MAG: hypothetical protein GXO02_03395 [Epsilonproteobacteria bacterium]|nr:hypothetical protein [Campylobacterota bacterium]